MAVAGVQPLAALSRQGAKGVRDAASDSRIAQGSSAVTKAARHKARLAAVILALAASGTSVFSQQGVTGDDPFIRVTQELWSFIKGKCALPAGGGYQIAILGVPPDDVRFTNDQKDFLAQKINAAASLVLRNEPQAKSVVSVREVAEMIAIMGAGQSRTAVDELIRKAENYNVAINILGGKVAHRGFRIALKAVGRNGVDCAEQTSAVDLPSDAFPENIIGADELLSRAAQHVLERSRDRREQTVALRSRLVDGSPAPDIWNESLARSFNRSVPMARSRLPSRSLESTELRAEAMKQEPPTDRWRTDIVLDRSVRVGTRLEVEVRPPQGAGQDSTAFDGLVDPDSLPPLPVERAPQPGLVAAAPPQAVTPPADPQPSAPRPVVTPAAPMPAPAPAVPLAVAPPAAADTAPAPTPAPTLAPTPAPTPAPAPAPLPAAVPPVAARSPEPAPARASAPPAKSAPQKRLAQPMPLSQTPQRFAVSLDAADKRQEFTFSTIRSTLVEIDITEVSGKDAPILGMINSNGRLVSPVGQPGKARPHLRRWRLPAGSYTLWLEHRGAEAVEVTMRSRAAFDSLVPEPLGQIVRVAGDWVVGVREQGSGEKVCYAFTSALETQPANWRVLAPFLLFQITPASDAVQHRFDGAEDWSHPERVVAEVTGLNRRERLPLRLEEGVFRALEPCRGQQGQCLSEAALYGMTTGNMITMLGATKTGSQGVVQYSLKGYQAAMYSMASLCSRGDFADRLVVRR
jgi:hypothetical protein